MSFSNSYDDEYKIARIYLNYQKDGLKKTTKL